MNHHFALKVALCVTLLLGSISAASAQNFGCKNFQFDLPNSFFSGSISGYAAQDFDQDGDLDLVFPGNLQTVTIVRGDGYGGFAPPQSYQTGLSNASVAAGEFNSDGKLDLIILGSQNHASLLLNDGAGGFGAPVLFDLPNGSGQYGSLLPVDLNGDGKTDLAAFGSSPAPPVTILLGNGVGGFSIAATPAIFSVAGQIKLGRFNADNITDIVFLHTNGTIDLIYGSSAGDFTVVGGGSFQDEPAGVDVIDLNHDNLDDLAVALKDTTFPTTHGFRTFTSTGTGFSAGTRIDLPPAGEPFGIAAGDFNGDGSADAAISLGAGILAVFDGRGNGAFQPPQYWVLPNVNGRLLAADVNLDNRKDLIFLANAGTSTIVPILNLNNQGFRTSRVVLYGGNDIVPADLTSDLRLDLVTAKDTFNTFTSDLIVAPNDGNRGFLPETRFTSLGDQRGLDAGDFNNDGKIDLVTAQGAFTNQVAVRFGNGAGGLGAPIVTNWPANVADVVAGNFNADTSADVLLLAASKVNVLAGLGNGSFNTTPLQVMDHDANYRPQLADFNHDGKIDIVTYFNGSLNCWLGAGNGTFTLSASIALTLKSFTVGDLNGDGNPDIAALRIGSETTLARLFGNGAGQFNAADEQIIPFGGGGETLLAADFNNDGFVDLVYNRQTEINNLVVVPSTAQTTGWTPPLFYSVGTMGGIPGLAVADYDHDGLIDIAYTNPGGSGVIYNKSGSTPCMSINDVTVTEGDTGTLNANFTVSLTVPSLDPVLVNYTLTPGTATSGVDYQNVSGRLLIPVGQPSGTVSVPIIGDLSDEFDETFTVTLSGATNGILDDAIGAGTILDNDPPPTLTIANATKSEGGSSLMGFQVALSVASGKPISVQYATANGTALANVDYTPNSGTLNIAPGDPGSGVSVLIIDDQMFEPDETLFVNISNATNAVLGNTQAQGTILNDDPVPTLEIGPQGWNEGDVGIQDAPAVVVISNPSYLPISLSYSTSNGTAIAGVDYQSASGNATIQPGALSAQLTMHLIGNTVNNPEKSFNITLSGITNANSGTLTAPFSIFDDEFVASDFDKDGRTDLSVFRPSDKTWYVLRSLTNTVSSNTFGLATDIPVSGDYDGDGRTDQAVFRPSTGDWYVRNPSLTVHWGQSGDIPAPGDFDNDGLIDEAVFRPTDGNWYILLSTGGTRTIHWGQSGDTPMTADYDGDGKADIAVFRPSESNWYILRSSDNAVTALHWGANGDTPEARDFDGDGRADIAVWRSSNGFWYVLRSSDGGVTYFQWGQAGDKPVPGNYDGDPKTDFAVYRDGTWYIYLSSNGTLVIKQFGLAGDTPIPYASSN